LVLGVVALLIWALGLFCLRMQAYPQQRYWSLVALVMSPIEALAVVWWAVVYPLARADDRRAAGCCPECGYNLRGNVSGRCSECGHGLTGNVSRRRSECGCNLRGILSATAAEQARA